MASKALASTAFLLSLNLIMMSMVSSTYMTVPSTGKDCSINTLELGVCASVLKLVNVEVGSPPTLPCCSLIHGLVDFEAAACLCTALKANVLGIGLDIPLSLSLVLNNCGKSPAFQCA